MGFILFRGPAGKLNFSVNAYVDASGHFRADAVLPAEVAKSVKAYLSLPGDGGKGALREKRAKRMRTLFALDGNGNGNGPHAAFVQAAGLRE